MATTDRASRVGLSRERIVAAALELFDQEGDEALTMRRLAAHLGVGTMTLYGYFGGKDELIDAIVDSGAARVAGAGDAGSWKERMRAFALELRAAHLAHPAVVELRLQRPLLSPGALDVTERGLAILVEGGFSTVDAVRLYRLLFIFTFGFSAFGPDRHGARDREATQAALSGLPPGRYPVLAGAADAAADAMAGDDLFELGLDRLLDGFEQMLG